MQLRKFTCPNCGGTLDINLDDKEYIFCPYCGDKFFIENGRKEYTINQNIIVKKDIKHQSSHTRHTIDEAAVIRAKTAAREQSHALIFFVACLAFLLLMMGFFSFSEESDNRAAQRAIASGKISAGSHGDYEGEHYEAVVEQLEALGFENISCVDLDDSGVLFWRSEKVESISIGGNTTFDKNDYFPPDERVIVKYH